MSAHNGLDTVLKLGIRAVIKTESLLRRSQPSNWRLVPVTRRDVQIPRIRESALSANQVLPQQGRRRRRPGRGSGYLKAEGGRDRRSRGARRTEGSGGQSQEVQHGSRQTGGGYAKRYRSLTAFSAWGGTTIQLPKLAAGGRGAGLNSAAVGGCHISQSGPEKTRAVTRKWEVEGAGPCDGREWAWPGELS